MQRSRRESEIPIVLLTRERGCLYSHLESVGSQERDNIIQANDSGGHQILVFRHVTRILHVVRIAPLLSNE